MSMYNCNFCELVLVLSQAPLKRGRVELHIDTKNKTKASEIANTGNREIVQFFSYVWLMPSLNLGQICNTQNSTLALSPRVDKYQRNNLSSLQGSLSQHECTLNITHEEV